MQPLLVPPPPWGSFLCTNSCCHSLSAPPQGSSLRLSSVMVRNDNSGSHPGPAVCPVACTLPCLEEHWTAVRFPPGWYVTPGSWDGKGLPYSEQSLGTFSPTLGLYPELYFHFVFQSSTAKPPNVRLEVTGAYKRPHKTKGPCTPGDAVPQAQQWHAGAQGRQLLVPPQSLLHPLPSSPGSGDFIFNNNSQ